MHRSTSLTLTAAALALAMAQPALTADYDPPILIEDAPSYVPVEVGSSWYLRGDVSYNFNSPVYDIDGADNLRFGGGVGVGYHFTDLLRGDVTINYIAKDELSFDDGTVSASVENRMLGAFANAYVDLGTFVGITPYVGVGAGLLHSRLEASLSTPSDAISETDRQHEFAYALHAGVSYQATRNVSLDFGYQYLKSPKTQYLDIDSASIREGVDFHQLKVGLRYDLW